MLLDEYIGRISRMEGEVIDALVEISEEAALNLKALVVKRVQQEGVGEYSDRDMPAFFYVQEGGEPRLDKTKSNAGREFIKKSVRKRESINWADIRDAEGLQTDFVDLTFTGEMFRGLHIMGSNVQGGRVTTILGGDREEVRNKLSWNVDRYGDFLQPDQKERELIIGIIQKRVTEKLSKILS